MNDQLDIFGTMVSVSETGSSKPRETIKSRWRKIHGFDYSHKCGNCRFGFRLKSNDRDCWKCDKMGVTSSEETDISKSDHACGMFEEES